MSFTRWLSSRPGNACKPYGRLNVAIGDDDPLGSFIFRTTGFNSIRTLSARLQYFQAISGNRLACLALELRLRGKSTRQSHGAPIYYVDITTRSGMSLDEVLGEAKRVEQQREASGFDQMALDAVARLGFSNGAFEDSDEEAESVVEEFFPEGETSPESGKPPPTVKVPESMSKSSLRDKLDQRALQSASVVLADPELA